MKRNLDQLSESEWNFLPLIHRNPTPAQRHELRVAIYYEYARESDSLRELARQYAALKGPKTNGADLLYAKPQALSDFTLIPFWNCILWPEFFPHTPWLEIPASERTKRIQSHVKKRPQEHLLRINESDQLAHYELPRRGGRCFLGTGENLILWLNWAEANNKEIVEVFAKWVRESRPKRYPEPRGDASRENVTAALLTRLAVMRLLHSRSHWDALALADGKVKMPMQQSNALKMRQQVPADLHRIFQSESFEKAGCLPLVPASEFPRRWATHSERKRTPR